MKKKLELGANIIENLLKADDITIGKIVRGLCDDSYIDENEVIRFTINLIKVEQQSIEDRKKRISEIRRQSAKKRGLK